MPKSASPSSSAPWYRPVFSNMFLVFNMMDEEQELRLLCKIYYLTNAKTKNFVKLLELGSTLGTDAKRKLIWIWPTANDLASLKLELESLNINCILSVGCGNGLLEWLLTEATGTKVCGLEIDRNWWQSKYAVKSFIELNYIEDAPTPSCTDYLTTCCAFSNWQFALMFCYFNNRPAFINYLNMYQGKWIIVIGPDPSVGVHTDPEPLDTVFPKGSNWKLRCLLNWTELNIVTIYEKLS